jgi:hypothetical protein
VNEPVKFRVKGTASFPWDEFEDAELEVFLDQDNNMVRFTVTVRGEDIQVKKDTHAVQRRIG